MFGHLAVLLDVGDVRISRHKNGQRNAALMQRALAEPALLPWTKAAMAEFENAVAGLAAPQARS